MAVLGLPVLIALVGLLIGGVRLAFVLWKGAKLTAVENYLVAFTARCKDAALALIARNKQIDAQPPKTGQDLEDGLNDAWRKKP